MSVSWLVLAESNRMHFAHGCERHTRMEAGGRGMIR